MRGRESRERTRPSPERSVAARLARTAMLAVLALASVAPPGTVSAQEGSPADAPGIPATEARVWGALVYVGDRAIEGLPGGEENPHFAAIEPRLRKIFRQGRHAVLLAEHTQAIFKEYESWVVPSKELFLKIDSRGPSPDGGTKIDLQVWQGDRVLVKTNAVLGRDAPLVIGGPKWRDGRLVFVVKLLGP